MILLIRRKWVLGAAALLLAVVSLLSLAERPRAAIPAFSYDALPTREVVIIDAGHGGSDGGAVSTAVRRKAASIWRLPCVCGIFSP